MKNLQPSKRPSCFWKGQQRSRASMSRLQNKLQSIFKLEVFLAYILCVHIMVQYTTVSILLSRCITPVTLCSQDLYFLTHQGNVHCEASAVRHFQSKLIFSWTSVCKLAKVPIVSFHCFISLKTMGLEKLTCTCMQTTAQGKIRILP